MGTRVEGIGLGGGGGWQVRLAEGTAMEADAVVLAAPSPKAAPLLQDLDPELASAVGEIRTAPLSVVALAFDAEDMGGPPDGFGFLVPRGVGPPWIV